MLVKQLYMIRSLFLPFFEKFCWNSAHLMALAGMELEKNGVEGGGKDGTPDGELSVKWSALGKLETGE